MENAEGKALYQRKASKEGKGALHEPRETILYFSLLWRGERREGKEVPFRWQQLRGHRTLESAEILGKV